jgi:2-keto-4-pentenoate hydratase/2-oxohepta-3-ene-1,7-dioic acid hydratase in catechol pathway
MRIVRFLWRDRVRWGVVEGDTIYGLRGRLWGEMGRGAELCPLGAVRLLAPVEPHSKVVGLGLTFRERGERDGPAMFMKQPTTNIGPMEPIVYPNVCSEVIHEAEVGLVIGRPACRVPASRAMEYVGGYTCVNDVTARSMKTSEGPDRSTRFKNFDTFCAIGPFIVTELDAQNTTIVCRVNSREAVRGNTRDMFWTMAEQIEWVTAVMTLMPGDIICTGCPAAGPLHIGDTVEVEVEGIGVLQNPVVAQL